MFRKYNYICNKNMATFTSSLPDWIVIQSEKQIEKQIYLKLEREEVPKSFKRAAWPW